MQTFSNHHFTLKDTQSALKVLGHVPALGGGSLGGMVSVGVLPVLGLNNLT